MCKLLNNMINRLFHGRTSRTVAVRGRFVGRSKTRDDAFKFRMGAGFAGDITRSMFATVEPAAQSNTPATAYGQAVIIAGDGTNGVRPLAAGDSALTQIHGFTVRPFPIQAPSAPNDFGGTQAGGGAVTAGGTPATKGAIDILKSGYFMAKWSGIGTAPVKGGAVDIWVAATAGAHIQGVTVETAHTGGSSAGLASGGGGGGSTYFNGPADANNNVEVAFNV